MSNLNGRIIVPWLAFEGLPEETFMSKFLSSGFTPATRKQAAAQPLEQAQILRVDQGVSGQLFVVIKPVPKARTYELDEAVVNAEVPGTWTTLTLARARNTGAQRRFGSVVLAELRPLLSQHVGHLFGESEQRAGIFTKCDASHRSILLSLGTHFGFRSKTGISSFTAESVSETLLRARAYTLTGVLNGLSAFRSF